MSKLTLDGEQAQGIMIILRDVVIAEETDDDLRDLANRATRMGLADRRLHVVRLAGPGQPGGAKCRELRSLIDGFQAHEALRCR